MSDNAEHDPVGRTIPELVDEIESLRTELAMANAAKKTLGDSNYELCEKIIERNKRIEELEHGRGVSTVPRKRRVIGEGYFITTAQIDKAWEWANDYSDPDARFYAFETLEQIGIVACEDCVGGGSSFDVVDGGKVHLEYTCPTCHGHKWRKK